MTWLGADRRMYPRDERSRNRLLRQVDWRFLLGEHRPARAVCFGDRRLASALELVCDKVDLQPGGPPGSYDVAVASNPDQNVLRAASGALQPGGSLFAQWLAPPLTSAAVEARLRRAGFEAASSYWVWPLPMLASPRVWLPTDAPGALRYFHDSRPPVHGAAATLRRGALQRALELGQRFGTLPICAVARKPGGPPDLVTTLRAHWKEWRLGATPASLSCLLLTGGHHVTRKVVALAFTEPDPEPRLVVKFARVPSVATALRREAAALEALERDLPDLTGVPRLVCFCDSASTRFLGQTPITGTPLFALLRPDTYRDLALAATDWLVRLAGRASPRPAAGWWGRLVQPVLDEFCASFANVVDPLLLEFTRSQLGQLPDMPLVFEHRDFWAGNVLMTSTGLGVLDWEDGEPRGLPALDLLYFLTDLAFFHDDAFTSRGFADSYRASLDSTTLTGRVRAECLARYAQAVGLGTSQLSALRLLVWLWHACWEARQLGGGDALRADPRELRGIRFLDLWQEEARRAVCSS